MPRVMTVLRRPPTLRRLASPRTAWRNGQTKLRGMSILILIARPLLFEEAADRLRYMNAIPRLAAERSGMPRQALDDLDPRIGEVGRLLDHVLRIEIDVRGARHEEHRHPRAGGGDLEAAATLRSGRDVVAHPGVELGEEIVG